MGRLGWPLAVWAPWVAVAGLPPLLAIPQLGEWLFFDDAVYATVARELLRGGALYADVFDHKPPIIHFWYAAIIGLGGGAEALRFSLFVSLGATAVLVTLVARRLFPERVAFLVGVTFGLSTALVLISANASVEQLMLLPMTASLLLYLRATESGRIRDLVLAGVLGALAVWTKPLAIHNLAAVAVLAVTMPGALRSVGAAKRIVALGAGSAAVSIVALALLAAAGVLPAAYDALVTFNLEYGGIASMGERRDQLAHAIWLAGVGLGPLWPPVLLGAAVLVRERSARATTLLVWAGASMAAALTTGFAFAHYFAHALPALALVAGAAYEAIGALRERPRLALGGALALVAAVAAGPTLGTYLDYPPATIPDEVRRFNEALALEDGAGRRLFVHGRLPQAYVGTSMRPAHRYFFQTPFLARPGLWSEVVADLEADPPDVIVEAPSEPVEFDLLSRTVTSPEFEQFLARDYEAVFELEGVTIYRRVATRERVEAP